MADAKTYVQINKFAVANIFDAKHKGEPAAGPDAEGRREGASRRRAS